MIPHFLKLVTQAIAKAYEVLTTAAKRKEYDHFRDRPDEYFKKYGSGVLWEYAPKSDATIIIILFLIAGSAFTYYAQKSRWQKIADHLIKAAVEDLSPREGGSDESVEIREQALEILAEMKKENGTSDKSDSGEDGAKNDKNDKKKKQKSGKVSSKGKKEKDQEELRPIIINLVNEIDDFGAGFHKPTVQDLLGKTWCPDFAFFGNVLLVLTLNIFFFSCENGKVALSSDQVGALVV